MAVRLTWSIYQAMKDPLSRLQQPLSSVTIFSDSQIALSWLAAAPSSTSPGVFICNRLKEIRRIVDALAKEGVTIRFAYVNTKHNPADAGTRGLTQQTLQHHFWWTGQEFLRTPSDHWPVTFYPHVTEEHPEEESLCAPGKSVDQENKEVHVLTTQTRDRATDLLDWKRHNRWILSQKVAAYVLRSIARLVARTNPRLRQRVELAVPELHAKEAPPYITATEMENALRILIRKHQQVHLPPSQQKVLKQLKLEKDEHGILRRRGRMGNSSLPVNARYSCLIATKTRLAQLIVEDAHSPLHCGIAHAMANVRKQFWIPKLRQMTRKLVGRCVPCQKLNNLPYRYPDMDDLPERRVQRIRPFEHIGIDYFGPLSAKRDDETVKVYGIILTCATTRMIHLELVPDMSTSHLLLVVDSSHEEEYQLVSRPITARISY
ncbi:hypothetical protein ANCDUO_05517 [Ancylostoma duodenale]|uniref:Integrase zinc-binding domain-containing protein n=1 Tax=Ancylostoma duodenale TaxID=51022 RepID=A0A0C2H434_9BILA|nr:hypothetical protein ANCDUO_05517 [Ancylostoma duodenale]